jgi:hypothetical protein
VSPSPSDGGTASGSVNKSFWWGGFKVTLGQISIKKEIKPTPPTYSQAPRKVLIEATFENLGKDTFTPYNQELVLQSGTNSYLTADSEDQKIPAVPGLQRTGGVIAFNVDDKFSLKSAVLLVGSARFNQASVPLGSSGKYVSLEPQRVAVNGTLAVPEAFTLAVSGGELSFDNVKQHQEEPAGSVYLTINFSLTSNRDNVCCFGDSNADLKLPDGTAIVSSQSSCCSIPPKGITSPDEFVEFAFKAADGSYDLIVKGKYGANNADEQGDLPFTITLGQSAAPGATPSVSGSLDNSPSSTQPSPSAGH